jgi:hypothetical protein
MLVSFLKIKLHLTSYHKIIRKFLKLHSVLGKFPNIKNTRISMNELTQKCFPPKTKPGKVVRKTCLPKTPTAKIARVH